MAHIDTDKFSMKLRERAIMLNERAISITNYHETDQEADLTEPPNCRGFGRIRHFKLQSHINWPQNPLPILPATKALKFEVVDSIRAQVFQNSVCNWRCWYCFVDFELLKGDSKHSKFITCDQLLELYLSEENPPA